MYKNVGLALYYQSLAVIGALLGGGAGSQAQANYHWWLAGEYFYSTKYMPEADPRVNPNSRNVWFGFGSGVGHADLHTASVWNQIRRPCGL
jgi:hypothetical protein